MSILNFAAFAGGKNLARNLFDKSSHDVIESGGFEISQCLAFSFNENGNNLSRITSLLTPLYFTVSHTSKNSGHEHSDHHMRAHGTRFLAVTRE